MPSRTRSSPIPTSETLGSYLGQTWVWPFRNVTRANVSRDLRESHELSHRHVRATHRAVQPCPGPPPRANWKCHAKPISISYCLCIEPHDPKTAPQPCPPQAFRVNSNQVVPSGLRPTDEDRGRCLCGTWRLEEAVSPERQWLAPPRCMVLFTATDTCPKVRHSSNTFSSSSHRWSLEELRQLMACSMPVYTTLLRDTPKHDSHF